MAEHMMSYSVEDLQALRRNIYADAEKLLADAGCPDDTTIKIINMMRKLETITEIRVVKTV